MGFGALFLLACSGALSGVSTLGIALLAPYPVRA
jgi:hypothetical protein